MRYARCLLAALAVIVSFPAQALFHLWRMEELYSNADGSIQFLELVAQAGSQQFLSGHTLRVTALDGTVRTFTFVNNLPGDTANKRMIVGTTGYAALGTVPPDYVVPNGFFSIPGGMISFSEGADVWNHPPIPTDGRTSRNRDGTTGTNSPRNFANQTGSVVPPGNNYQALWWASPAGSENGWGVNITHQGEILFATWFTYDVDGSGMWLVVSDARRTTGNTYVGDLFRTTGPPLNTDPFPANGVFVTKVGTVTFNFTDTNNGTFAYTVNNVSQTKSITRQVFSTPVADCAANGPAGSRIVYQDLWWKSPAGSENGWGVNITHQGDILFATWFTYDAAGKGLWLVMSDGRRTTPTSNVYTGKLYRTSGPPFNSTPWNSSALTVSEVGDATFTFTDATNGTFRYTLTNQGVTQTKAITRQVYSSPATVCR